MEHVGYINNLVNLNRSYTWNRLHNLNRMHNLNKLNRPKRLNRPKGLNSLDSVTNLSSLSSLRVLSKLKGWQGIYSGRWWYPYILQVSLLLANSAHLDEKKLKKDVKFYQKMLKLKSECNIIGQYTSLGINCIKWIYLYKKISGTKKMWPWVHCIRY